MLNTLVSLRQLNEPELSGYILQFISGANTGVVNNYYINSGSVTTGQTGNFVTLSYLNSALSSLSTQGNVSYYPNSNPSGFISTGGFFGMAQLNISGLQWVDPVNNFDLLYIDPYSFSLAGPNSIIEFYHTLNNPNTTNPYISGFNIWANDVNTPTINGLPVITSGYIQSNYVNWTQFTNNKSTGFNFLYLIDSIKSLNSKFNQGSDFYFKGQSSTFISNPYIIDLYGSLATNYSLVSGQPYILGFDLYSNKIQISGYNVFTALDVINSGFINQTQLLSASGYLQDNIDRFDTGSYYPLSNPSGYVTGLNTGNFVSSSQTGRFYSSSNPSGYITSGQFTGLVSGLTITNVVYQTGNQTVSGNKVFVNGLQASIFSGSGLYDNTNHLKINLPLSNLIDLYNTQSLNWTARNLFDLTGINSINWANRLLTDSNSSSSVDWQNRYLKDYSSIQSVDWNNRLLSNTGFGMVDWGNLFLNTPSYGGTTVLNWNTCILYENSPVNLHSLDWQNRICFDGQGGGIQSLNWSNRQLLNNTSNFTLDWQNLVLSGNWNVSGNLSINGNSATTGGPYYPLSNPNGYATGLSVNTGSFTGVFYPLHSNPSGYITSLQTGIFITTGQTGSFGGGSTPTGNLTGAFYPLLTNPYSYISGSQTGVFVTTGQTGKFITTGQTGIFVDISTNQNINGFKIFQNTLFGNILSSTGAGFGDINLNTAQLMAGSTTLDWHNLILSGNWNAQNLSISGSAVVTASQTGIFITTGQTGAFSSSGNFYPLNSNPSGYITSGQTGSFITNTGILTGVFYPLLTNPSGYITNGQTGNFITNFQTGIFITTGQTGSFGGGVTTGNLTGAFYPLGSNPSGYLTLTGISGYVLPSVNYTTNINWAAANTFYTILTGNTNFTFSNQGDGRSIIVTVANSGNNGFSGTWPSGLRWPHSNIPFQSSGSFTDIYTFICITGAIYGNVVQGFN